jgi:K+ transporter
VTLADKKVDVTSPSKLAALAALGIVFGDIGTSPLFANRGGS